MPIESFDFKELPPWEEKKRDKKQKWGGKVFSSVYLLLQCLTELLLTSYIFRSPLTSHHCLVQLPLPVRVICYQMSQETQNTADWPPQALHRIPKLIQLKNSFSNKYDSKSILSIIKMLNCLRCHNPLGRFGTCLAP